MGNLPSRPAGLSDATFAKLTESSRPRRGTLAIEPGEASLVAESYRCTIRDKGPFAVDNGKLVREYRLESATGRRRIRRPDGLREEVELPQDFLLVTRLADALQDARGLNHGGLNHEVGSLLETLASRMAIPALDDIRRSVLAKYVRLLEESVMAYRDAVDGATAELETGTDILRILEGIPEGNHVDTSGWAVPPRRKATRPKTEERPRVSGVLAVAGSRG